MDNNFLTNGGKNKFLDEEVDDDEFLRHPKSGTSGYLLPHQAGYFVCSSAFRLALPFFHS